MNLFCLKFVCLFSCSADVHLSQNQRTLCPVLPYFLFFSRVIPILPTAAQQGLGPWKWSEEISRLCDGIYPHPRAWLNLSEHSNLWQVASERLRNLAVKWGEQVQLMSLEPKGRGVRKYDVHCFWDWDFWEALLVLTFLPIGWSLKNIDVASCIKFV